MHRMICAVVINLAPSGGRSGLMVCFYGVEENFKNTLRFWVETIESLQSHCDVDKCSFLPRLWEFSVKKSTYPLF